MHILVTHQFSISEPLRNVLSVVSKLLPAFSIEATKPNIGFVSLNFYSDEQQKIEILKHIDGVAANTQPIDCVFRCAMLTEDVVAGYHVRLVPDEGFSQIIKLHNKLYTGILEPYYKQVKDGLGEPFIPGYSISWVETKSLCRQMVNSINQLSFEIQVRITDLVIKELRQQEFDDWEWKSLQVSKLGH